MSDAKTVQVFVVVADAPKDNKNCELGRFFKVTDADKFAAKLGTHLWSNVRVLPQNVALSDVHPAHLSLLQ